MKKFISLVLILPFLANASFNITPKPTNLPSGMITEYAGQTAPTGWLICDGTAVSRTTYSVLFTAIGTSYGIGDGSTTFNVPDRRGYFPRGADNMGTGAAGTDPDAASRTAAVSGTFTVTGGATTNTSPTITVSSTTNLAPGMTVSGTGIPASSVVRVVLTSTTFTLGDLANSANVNATATNSSLTFTLSKSATGNYIGSIQGDQFQTHTHANSLGATTTARNTSGFYGANTGGVNNDVAYVQAGTTGTVTITGSVGSPNSGTTGTETRPKNGYAGYIIKQ